MGIAVAVLLIALVSFAPRPQTAEVESLNRDEAVTIVANEMRSPAAALRVAREGQARFDNGNWIITVGDAAFRFNQRTRVVLHDNEAALLLRYQGA